MEGDTGNGAAGGEEGAGGAASGPAPNDAVKQRPRLPKPVADHVDKNHWSKASGKKQQQYFEEMADKIAHWPTPFQVEWQQLRQRQNTVLAKRKKSTEGGAGAPPPAVDKKAVKVPSGGGDPDGDDDDVIIIDDEDGEQPTAKKQKQEGLPDAEDEPMLIDEAAAGGGPSVPAAHTPAAIEGAVGSAEAVGSSHLLRPVCPDELKKSSIFNEAIFTHVLEVLEKSAETVPDGELQTTLQAVHRKYFVGGKALPLNQFRPVCEQLIKLDMLMCTNLKETKDNNKRKFRLAPAYYEFQMSHGRKDLQRPAGVPVMPQAGSSRPPPGESGEEFYRKAHWRERNAKLESDSQKAEQDLQAALEEVKQSLVFQEALKFRDAASQVAARDHAKAVVAALMDTLKKGATTLSRSVPTVSYEIARPTKRAGFIRVGHENMGSVYGIGGGAALLPQKILYLLVLMVYWKLEIMVLSEMPASSEQVLQELLPPGQKWAFKVSGPISQEGARFEERVVWLYNTSNASAEGEPVCVSDWVPSTRMPAYLELRLWPTGVPAGNADNKTGSTLLRLYGLHFAPVMKSAQEDVRHLGLLARNLSPAEKMRSIFAGDFNLAPTPELKPSPQTAEGKSAFEELSKSGFHAANFLRTNLLSVAKGTEPRVYDNFLVHADLWKTDSGAPLHLESMKSLPPGHAESQRAFVVHLDDLLIAQAAALDYPEEWLIKGLTSAAEEPHKWVLALLDSSTPDEDAGAKAAAGKAAQGVSQLGLFDHCLSFIDLSLLQ